MSNEEQRQGRREADGRTPVARVAVDQRESGAGEPRPAWRRPVVTRFGLERTLNSTGSFSDVGFPSPFRD